MPSARFSKVSNFESRVRPSRDYLCMFAQSKARQQTRGVAHKWIFVLKPEFVTGCGALSFKRQLVKKITEASRLEEHLLIVH